MSPTGLPDPHAVPGTQQGLPLLCDPAWLALFSDENHESLGLTGHSHSDYGAMSPLEQGDDKVAHPHSTGGTQGPGLFPDKPRLLTHPALRATPLEVSSLGIMGGLEATV